MKIYVITDPELGWDCVIGAYLTLEDAIKHCLDRSGLDINTWEDYVDNQRFDCAVIHEETLYDKFEIE